MLYRLTRCALSLLALVTAINWATLCLWVVVEGGLAKLLIVLVLVFQRRVVVGGFCLVVRLSSAGRKRDPGNTGAIEGRRKVE